MKAIFHFLVLFLISFSTSAQLKVEDFYRKEDGKNDAPSIQRAMDAIDSIGHGSVEFNGTKTYQLQSSIQLPGAGKGNRRIIILNGNGCEIKANGEFSIFRRIPKDQSEALNNFMATRFFIRDFSFTGGNKAIDLGASYASEISGCNFVAQKLAAIDVQFGLQTRITHCIVTNPATNGIVLRCGEDWGGTSNNSQSNHSVIESCRVFAAIGGHTMFQILGSSGVVLRDIISEGSHEVQYAVYFSKQGSTTVRLFSIENFHLEHAPQAAGIFVNHNGIVTIDGLFYQHAYDCYKLIQAAANAEQITLRNIPHFVAGTVLYSGNNEVPWRIEYCAKEFYLANTFLVESKKGTERKLPYYFSGMGGKYQVGKKYGN